MDGNWCHYGGVWRLMANGIKKFILFFNFPLNLRCFVAKSSWLNICSFMSTTSIKKTLNIARQKYNPQASRNDHLTYPRTERRGETPFEKKLLCKETAIG